MNPKYSAVISVHLDGSNDRPTDVSLQEWEDKLKAAAILLFGEGKVLGANHQVEVDDEHPVLYTVYAETTVIFVTSFQVEANSPEEAKHLGEQELLKINGDTFLSSSPDDDFTFDVSNVETAVINVEESENKFNICLFGLSSKRCHPVPSHIQDKLILAATPKEIETVISESETELAQLLNELDEFLACDSAAELMADVLNAKGIEYEIICGVNDIGDSHSYIEVDGQYYDPTDQGFGVAS